MKQVQEADRRIVNNNRFAANVGKKVSFSLVSVGFLLMGGLATLVTLTLLLGLTQPDYGDHSETSLYPTWASVFVCISLLFFYAGVRAFKVAKKIQPGVFITSADTAHLSAPASLVRASQEPIQAQEGVLLRAAAGEASEEHEEQLLRAAAAGEQA